jgi:hypothetical protein
MSKKLLYLLGILLTIIAGTLLHWRFSCDCGSGLRNTGAAKPDNNTPERRAKNRRTVISIN